MGQSGTTGDRLGQSGTLSTDCDGATRCHKKPQKATRGHEKQQKATEIHKSDSRRQFGTLCHKRLQMGATENSWGSKGAGGCIRGQFRTKGDTRSVIWAR